MSRDGEIGAETNRFVFSPISAVVVVVVSPRLTRVWQSLAHAEILKAPPSAAADAALRV